MRSQFEQRLQAIPAGFGHGGVPEDAGGLAAEKDRHRRHRFDASADADLRPSGPDGVGHLDHRMNAGDAVVGDEIGVNALRHSESEDDLPRQIGNTRVVQHATPDEQVYLIAVEAIFFEQARHSVGRQIKLGQVGERCPSLDEGRSHATDDGDSLLTVAHRTSFAKHTGRFASALLNPIIHIPSIDKRIQNQYNAGRLKSNILNRVFSARH